MNHTRMTLEQVMSTFPSAVPENDLVHMFAPLMREIATLHAAGKVANVHPEHIVEDTNGALSLLNPTGLPIKNNHRKLLKLQPAGNSALNIVGDLAITDESDYGEVHDLNVHNTQDALNRPMYLLNYTSWESAFEHHDELTDVFQLGLIIAACACHLDFNNKSDLQSFSLNRTNLFRLNSRLHPVIATLIEEMTHLNRHDRESDMHLLALRLENYRDQQGRFNADQIIDKVADIPQRRTAVLSKLRDRLFDLSKRNRLVHFKTSQSSVNLTVASVPLVMRTESIRKDQLCTWGGSFADAMLLGKYQALGRWLRFEDQPYLPSVIDKLLTQSRRDKAEYGFSSLRLVIGFLNWYNVKEPSSKNGTDDKICSPLLWLNVDVKKKKGVRDQYLIKSYEAVAEINPALRHYLKQLYNIDLPEQIDLTKHSVGDLHEQLAKQIAMTEPDVSLHLTSQPSIQLIHQRAIRRLRKFEKRRGKRAYSSLGIPKFSYDSDNYEPLGRAIFEKYIQIDSLPQGAALGEVKQSRPNYMTGSAAAESQTYALTKEDKGKYGWEINLAEVTLANFNYKKMSLVRDYNELIEQSHELDSLDRLFSIKPKEAPKPLPNVLPVEQQWNVVPSDMTQDQAVALAREGESFIIQGPPGTGKSQTITNLIGDYAARGKRVLFVCEKRAALDVVFNRLKQAGLEKLACIIHDIQEDKKPFIHDLKAVYEEWFDNRSQHELVEGLRTRTLAAFSENFDAIKIFESLLGQLSAQNSLSIRELIRQQVSLPELNLAYTPEIRERLPTVLEWQASKNIAEGIETRLQEHFEQASLASFVFSLLSNSAVQSERAVSCISEHTNRGETLSDNITHAIYNISADLPKNYSLNDIASLAKMAQRAIELNLVNKLDLLNASSALAITLKKDLSRIAHQETLIEELQAGAKYWKEPLSKEDTLNALNLAKQQEGSFFSFFNGSWRALKKTLHGRYDFSQHAIKPSITSVLEKLADLHSQEDVLSKLQAELNTYLESDSPHDLLALSDEIKNTSQPSVSALFTAENSQAIIRQVASCQGEIEELSLLISGFLNSEHYNLTFDRIQEVFRDMRESLDDLPVLLPLLRASYEVDEKSSFVLLNVQSNTQEMEALVVDEALQIALRKHPELSRFDIGKLASYTARTAKARDLLLSQNAELINAGRHQLFNDHVRHSTLSTSQLNTEEIAYKKMYSNGRREVEHEFGKSMRYRSIRDMASDDTGAVVSDLKPIWLMSPLSVSDTLPLQANLFDVVIFDEASQIPVEDGIPALCRAPQLIVVGDEMQLPPTSFFSSSIDEEDTEIEVQENGEVISLLLDADSLLAQAARHLPATLLAWHYRSRSESLISFSNAAFYDGKLVTIPDQRVFREAKTSDDNSAEIAQIAEEFSAQSNTDEAQIDAKTDSVHVEKILATPISYHFIKEGVYESRSNQAEADTIAIMIRDLLTQEIGKTIGIVAFSEAQQNCIEDALENLAETDTQFANLLEEEYLREDDDQFNGLFVKNLENVQGDERDIIILSICYAPNPSGKMLMNFGPINQRGGEKRLNVIFSRARQHMVVVTSIKATAITNTHNDGAFALRTFLSFAEARSKGNYEAGRIALSSVNPKVLNVFNAAPPADSLRSALLSALQGQGHQVEEYVGSAQFRVDLAILDPATGNYKLGILLDHKIGDTEGHIFERFVFKPNILRAFGWNIIDISTSAWQASPSTVIANIEHVLTQPLRLTNVSEDDLFENISLPSFSLPTHVTKSNQKSDNKNDNTQSKTSIDKDFQTFVFKQGKSDKFWRIAQQDLDVIVHYGRVGTKGQTITKSYDTPERAKRQVSKLVLEKTRKGYVED
jgi:predicted DNA-binding WGR domain protein